MKTKLIILVMLSFILEMNAQVIEKSSIDSGGSIAENGNIKMIYTIGETNIQELNAGDVKVSEGFISGNLLDFSLSTDDPTKTLFEISLFPNPVLEFFRISGLKEKINLVIYDSTGKEVLRKGNYLNEIIDIGQFVSGVYIVKLSHDTLNIAKRIVKN